MMKLLYFEDVTPADYQPAFFKNVDDGIYFKINYNLSFLIFIFLVDLLFDKKPVKVINKIVDKSSNSKI